MRAWAWLRRCCGRGHWQLEEGCEEALRGVLHELGATVSETDWAVAGAIERTEYTITLGHRRARLTCHTYEGPWLSGDVALVDLIGQRLAERSKAAAPSLPPAPKP